MKLFKWIIFLCAYEENEYDESRFILNNQMFDFILLMTLWLTDKIWQSGWWPLTIYAHTLLYLITTTLTNDHHLFNRWNNKRLFATDHDSMMRTSHLLRPQMSYVKMDVLTFEWELSFQKISFSSESIIANNAFVISRRWTLLLSISFISILKKIASTLVTNFIHNSL